jgi:hypothetical protein
MIRLTRLTAAPAYMSLTAFSTGAGAAGRTGAIIGLPPDSPPDGYFWYMVTSAR